MHPVRCRHSGLEIIAGRRARPRLVEALGEQALILFLDHCRLHRVEFVVVESADATVGGDPRLVEDLVRDPVADADLVVLGRVHAPERASAGKSRIRCHLLLGGAFQ